MDERKMLIEILVRKLGGQVTVTTEDCMYAMEHSGLVIYKREIDDSITYRVYVPPSPVKVEIYDEIEEVKKING